MTKEQFIGVIATLPKGQSRGAVGQSCFASITRTAEGYQIDCGWIVPEAHDDDYDSYGYQPFRAPQPWIGRRLRATDADVAVNAYETFYATVVKQRGIPAEGETIGSVTR